MHAAPNAALRPAPRILIVGDCMLDRYWSGEVERISPEAPVPILHVRSEYLRAGGAANVALNLVDLGSPVTLLTLLGADRAAEQLMELITARGVTMLAMQDARIQTTQKIRSVCRHQQLLRLDFEEPPDPGCVESLSALFADHLPQHDWVVFSDYAKGSLQYCAAMIERALHRRCKVLVDPKGRDYTHYRGAYLLKPNLSEVRAVLGDWRSEGELQARAQALRANLCVEHLLITRGQDGMSWYSACGDGVHIPAEIRDVYDVSGAGDTVLATLAHCLSLGWPMLDALRLANKAAGIVVGKFGTASVTPDELGLTLGPPQ